MIIKYIPNAQHTLGNTYELSTHVVNLKYCWDTFAWYLLDDVATTMLNLSEPSEVYNQWLEGVEEAKLYQPETVGAKT